MDLRPMVDNLRTFVASLPWLQDERIQFVLAGFMVACAGWLLGRIFAGSAARWQARPSALTAVLAELEGPSGRRQTLRLMRRLARALQADQKDAPVILRLLGRTLGAGPAAPEGGDGAGDQTIADVLSAETADVVVWGTISDDGKSSTLCFAAADPKTDRGDPTQFAPAEIRCPAGMPEAVATDILAMAVLGSVAPLARERSIAMGPLLQPMVRRLSETVWDPDEGLAEPQRFDARRALGWGHLVVGFETEDAAALDQSSDIFRDILRSWPSDCSFEERAELELNYAAASLAVAEANDDRRHYERAERASAAALKTFKRTTHPRQWAFLQNRLGRAQAVLGVLANEPSRLQGAVQAFSRALRVWQRDDTPALWSATRRRYASALFELGRRTVGTDALERSAAAYREALLVLGGGEAASDAPGVRRALAEVLIALGQRRPCAYDLEEAIRLLEPAAAQDDDAEGQEDDAQGSRERAGTLHVLGRAHLAVGKVTGDVAAFEKAVDRLRHAAEALPEATPVIDRLAYQRRLGAALTRLGSRAGRPEPLHEAVATLRTALGQLDEDATAADRADAHRRLGQAYAALGRLDADGAWPEAAAEAFQSALDGYTREKHSRAWSTIQCELADALMLQARKARGNGADQLKHAVSAYREALWRTTRAKEPLEWARIQNKLGQALALWGSEGGGTPCREQAVRAQRWALEEWTRDRVPADRAAALTALGNVLADLALNERETDRYAEATAVFAEAYAIYRANGSADLAELARRNLEGCQRAIEVRRDRG
ncbi:MAG: hypothetical protein ACR2PO_02390 [Methyloligellaceae bacterium]